ncbi:hypothetical protein GPJ56_007752 [Histomonas meleagridis]|uniref:uncharacterized protein n=1 Tax=Histomonas meleagridis TaxID=135588 RepID=UPI00355AAB4D|nr:hypothetical protein GPJ56_007752 [Histomonas meleagridis]KAH0798770.1 hypothetical protein GO595_008635 [Histomonas meleagridis]
MSRASILNIVHQTINGNRDEIDFAAGFMLVDHLNQANNQQDFSIFQEIIKIAREGNRQKKINCIALIDMLFKNGNRNLIQILQTPNAIFGLSDEQIVNDPEVHTLLCRDVQSWVDICKQQGGVRPEFIDWQTRLYSFKYTYVMTQEIANKFGQDFAISFELLNAFTDSIISASHQDLGPNFHTIQEILPNVNEIHQRLKELKPSMKDEYAREVIDFLIEYCLLCKQSYNDYRQIGEFDESLLRGMEHRGIPRRHSPPPQQQMPQQYPGMQSYQPPGSGSASYPQYPAAPPVYPPGSGTSPGYPNGSGSHQAPQPQPQPQPVDPQAPMYPPPMYPPPQFPQFMQSGAQSQPPQQQQPQQPPQPKAYVGAQPMKQAEPKPQPQPPQHQAQQPQYPGMGQQQPQQYGNYQPQQSQPAYNGYQSQQAPKPQPQQPQQPSYNSYQPQQPQPPKPQPQPQPSYNNYQPQPQQPAYNNYQPQQPQQQQQQAYAQYLGTNQYTANQYF